MTCPRCRAEITARPDAGGVIVCTACKAQLKVRSAAAGTAPAGAATLPAGVRAPVAHPAKPGPAASPPAVPASLEAVMSELQGLRGGQDEILSILKSSPPAAAGAAPDADDPYAAPAPRAVRTGRRKSVLVIDDDEQTRAAAVAALEQAEVPVRTANDGNAGLEAMAADRPDVVVMELGLDGRMAGKDVVNMIKATMDWVDIPIVLYTRVLVESQKDARLIHGADELVQKGPGAPEALVARVIALFRRG